MLNLELYPIGFLIFHSILLVQLYQVNLNLTFKAARAKSVKAMHCLKSLLPCPGKNVFNDFFHFCYFNQ